MKKIFLHIGFHKTGTSSLQETLNRGRKKLLERGVWYPESKLGFPAQQEIAWSLVNKPRPWMNIRETADQIYDGIIARFMEQAADTMILSSEDLTFIENDAKAMNFVKSKFAEFDVKIIAYVRNPIEFLLSLYGHRMRLGEVRQPFMEYYSNNMNHNIACYAVRLKQWENIFGLKNIRVRKYDPENFYAGNIASDFLYALDLDNIALEQPKVSNESLHPWLSELFVRIAAEDDLPDDKRAIYQTLMSMSKTFPKVGTVEFYLDDREKMFLQGVHKDSNALLAKKYGVSLD